MLQRKFSHFALHRAQWRTYIRALMHVNNQHSGKKKKKNAYRAKLRKTGVKPFACKYGSNRSSRSFVVISYNGFTQHFERNVVITGYKTSVEIKPSSCY